jgi:hypothetical protein
MYRFGRLAVAAMCVTVWLTAAAGIADATGPAGSTGSANAREGAAPQLSCSVPLKLYDGTNLTGANVSISERGTWINLGPLGFDNRTSSFKVGACTVDLASLSNGGGALYDTCHNPGCVENTMDPGWNNVISSVYIH